MVEAERLELSSGTSKEQASTSVSGVLSVPLATLTGGLTQTVIVWCFPRRYTHCADR